MPKEDTREVRVYGHSDDLVEVEGGFYDEFDCWNTPVSLVFAGVLRVKITYGDDGNWLISTEPVDKDIPSIPVTISDYESGYSQLATFTVPEGLPFTMVREFLRED